MIAEGPKPLRAIEVTFVHLTTDCGDVAAGTRGPAGTIAPMTRALDDPHLPPPFVHEEAT